MVASLEGTSSFENWAGMDLCLRIAAWAAEVSPRFDAWVEEWGVGSPNPRACVCVCVCFEIGPHF